MTPRACLSPPQRHKPTTSQGARAGATASAAMPPRERQGRGGGASLALQQTASPAPNHTESLRRAGPPEQNDRANTRRPANRTPRQPTRHAATNEPHKPAKKKRATTLGSPNRNCGKLSKPSPKSAPKSSRRRDPSAHLRVPRQPGRQWRQGRHKRATAHRHLPAGRQQPANSRRLHAPPRTVKNPRRQREARHPGGAGDGYLHPDRPSPPRRKAAG